MGRTPPWPSHFSASTLKRKEGSAISQAHFSVRLARFQGRCIRSGCFTYHCDHPSAEHDVLQCLWQHQEPNHRKTLTWVGFATVDRGRRCELGRTGGERVRSVDVDPERADLALRLICTDTDTHTGLITTTSVRGTLTRSDHTYQRLSMDNRV